MSEVKFFWGGKKIKGRLYYTTQKYKRIWEEEPACEIVTILTIEAESHRTQSKKGENTP